MKVKVLDAITAGGLEKKVNGFIAEDGVKVLEIQFQATSGYVSAMVLYEDNRVSR